MLRSFRRCREVLPAQTAPAGRGELQFWVQAKRGLPMRGTLVGPMGPPFGPGPFGPDPDFGPPPPTCQHVVYLE